VQFAAGKRAGAAGAGIGEPEHGEAGHGEPGQIQAATVDGHVVLVQQPVAKPGAGTASTLRATGDRATYEGAGELLHLTGSPRVDDGDLQLTADRIDVSQASGDAFAHGNVKATWFGSGAGDPGKPGGSSTGQQGVVLGGQGPAHAIAAEAQFHQSSGEATFRGQARLWQQANSIAAPIIVLDRTKQTLAARATSAAEPVRVVLLSAAGQGGRKNGKASTPSVIRVSGGDLKYSAGERKAVMRRGAMRNVVAETAEATTNSAEVELILQPQGNHAGKDGGAAQVDRLTARGQVEVSSQGRRGTGEQLVYTESTDEYVLTGTAAVPPKLTDAARGTVTGEALIFNSRDDSVSIEGDGQKTTTETTVKKK
jgi:lipopolysaccharide export system protein LptA